MARGRQRDRAAWAGVAVVCCGLAVGAGGLAWLLQSAAGLPRTVAVHGALMITAWGVMLPAGGIVARYFKVTRTQDFPAELDNPFWWRWHRVLQYGGVAAATAGLAAILSATGGRFDTAHGRLGLLVMILAWLQIVSAALRGSKGGPTDKQAEAGDPATWRGDHYDMTPRRLRFERWHKPAGWAASGVAALTLLLGVALVGAPAWLLLLVAGLQGAALLTVVDSVLRRRWVDTYHALWGPGPSTGLGQGGGCAPSQGAARIGVSRLDSDRQAAPDPARPARRL